MHRPFNSTRCIRNEDFAKALQCKRRDFQLHTVHQELPRKFFGAVLLMRAFNSTRCIRNWEIMLRLRVFMPLSTPHGALGTFPSQKRCVLPANNFQLHTVHQEPGYTEAKTGKPFTFQLHTVHQERLEANWKPVRQGPFNSTRCIRNLGLKATNGQGSALSTPHGALGTSNCHIN